PRELLDGPGLPDPGVADERHDGSRAALGLPERAEEGGELGLAPDEWRSRGVAVARRRRRLRPDANPRALCLRRNEAARATARSVAVRSSSPKAVGGHEPSPRSVADRPRIP